MLKMSIDDLIIELDDARAIAKETDKPSAMIAATLAKAKLLGLDKDVGEQYNEPLPVQIIVNVKDARKYPNIGIN